MSEERRYLNLRMVTALAVAVLALELALVRVASGGRWDLAAAGHVALVAALGGWSWFSPGMRRDIRLPLLLWVNTAALGPVGTAGTLATMALARWYARKALPFEEWYRSLFPDTRQDAGTELFERLDQRASQNGESVTAFTDVLAFGSLHQKQSLIALVTTHFRPAFGPVLKKALTDSRNAIRVQAATAMNKIENTALEETLRLTKAVGEHPEDVETLRSLARHYDDYLFSGILDARREEEMRGLALDAYRTCIAAQPSDRELRLAAARLLLRSGRYTEAVEYLEAAIAAGLHTPQAALWHMESLFRLGRFDRLRELARTKQDGWESLSDFPADAQDAVRLWAGEATVEEESVPLAS